MKMWLLLVTTVASLVLADTGYQYNAPNVPFRLPNNQQANNYQSYNSQRYNYNMQDEFNSNAIKKGYVTGHSNNQYTGYNQPFMPLIPFNDNYAQGNLQHAASPVVVGSNIGYTQQAHLPVTSNKNLNGDSYSNSYTQLPSISLNPPRDAQPSTGSFLSNHNNGYSYVPPPYNGQHNIQPQPFTPVGGNNLNGNFVNPANNAGAYNNGYVEQKPQTSNAIGNSYSSQSSNNVYSQSSITSAGSNVNSGYDNGFTPVPFNSNNGYTDNGPSRNQLNVGHSQSSSQANGVTANNVYEQSYTATASSNVKTGYEQRTSTSNVNNGFVSSQISNAGGSPNNGYLQPSSGPTHIDLNSNLVVTSTSNNLASGLVQKSEVSGANISPVSSGSNLKVTPIIHKHIYFHVPPPEIEETVQQVAPPQIPKKNYKILFIKMPSQEPKSNLIRLQEQMRNAAVEDRTLIYVLVKKPEESKPVVLPKPKPSDHQVFFVKYNDSPFDIAARVSDEIDKTGSINSIVPLEPGLVNGREN